MKKAASIYHWLQKGADGKSKMLYFEALVYNLTYFDMYLNDQKNPFRSWQKRNWQTDRQTDNKMMLCRFRFFLLRYGTLKKKTLSFSSSKHNVKSKRRMGVNFVNTILHKYFFTNALVEFNLLLQWSGCPTLPVTTLSFYSVDSKPTEPQLT